MVINANQKIKPLVVFLLALAVVISGCVPGAAGQSATQVPTAAATLPPADPAPTSAPLPNETAVPAGASVQYPEDAPVVRLRYDPAVTGPVEVKSEPAVGSSPDLAFFQAHPSFVQFRLPEFGKGQVFQLPFPLDVPQIHFYRVADFGGYGNEDTLSYSNQASRLSSLIAKEIDPNLCVQPLAGYENDLPFLPLVNSAQVLCAKPQLVTFAGGKGIRYLAYYSQGMDPLLDGLVFYTFQGLSADGQYYLSAILPVRTNSLPDQPPADGSQPDLQELQALLRGQVALLNQQADDMFTPSLNVLDQVVAGIEIPGE